MVRVKENNLNFPNFLALLRLFLVPVVVYLVTRGNMVLAGIIFLSACFTDLLDGYIARRYHKTTKLGTWLDPLADKLMAVSVIVTFTIRGIFPVFVMLVIFIKEFLTLLGGLLALKKGAVTPANIFGKIASLALNTAIMGGFLYRYLTPYYLWWTYAALAGSVIAFVQYTVKNRHLIFDKKGQEKEE